MQNARLIDTKQSTLDPERQIRVLVVDDVPTNRAVLKSLLVQPNCEVVEAGDGERALQFGE